MSNYKTFINNLASYATSFEDDTTKCMELVKYFKNYFDTLLHLGTIDSKIVIQHLDNIQLKYGDIILKYPLFYKEFEGGISSFILEKYVNILYLIEYIIEMNEKPFEVYRQTGLFALDLISVLTSEFLNSDIEVSEDSSEIDDLMNQLKV